MLRYERRHLRMQTSHRLRCLEIMLTCTFAMSEAGGVGTLTPPPHSSNCLHSRIRNRVALFTQVVTLNARHSKPPHVSMQGDSLLPALVG